VHTQLVGGQIVSLVEKEHPQTPVLHLLLDERERRQRRDQNAGVSNMASTEEAQMIWLNAN